MVYLIMTLFLTIFSSCNSSEKRIIESKLQNEFDLIDLVDPMVAEPLVEVEGLLWESAGERRRSRAW